MPVILDNIHFYHGPSKPAKPPYFAFNSNQKGSNTLLSGEQPSFSNEAVSSATEDYSAMVPPCFLPPAGNAENTTNQHAAGSPNLFDLELARSWGALTPLLGTLEASDRDASPSLQRLDYDYRDNSDEKVPADSPSSFRVNPSKRAELDGSDVFPRPQSSCTTPLQPPRSPSISVLSPGAAETHSGVMQSVVTEDVQWTRDQLSYPAYFESSNLVHASDMSDMSTAFSDYSSNTPLSSILSCSDVVSNNRNDIFSCVPSQEDYPDDHSDDYAETSQTRLISDYPPRTVAESGPSGPSDPLHVNMPDLMDLEQAYGRESFNSRSRTPSVRGDKSPNLANPRKCKNQERPMPSTRKRETTCNERYPSVAVVIPPPRPRAVRSLRSRPKPVVLDASESESEDVDDSSDEDFMTDTIQSEPPHVEDSVEEKNGSPSTTASCYPNHMSFGSSSRHCCESRDIVGRAILTIETQGSEPTFFFTLVPDNVYSTSSVAAHSPPHNSEKADRVLKRSLSMNRSTRGKSKFQRYSTDEDNLLVKLKEEGRLTWKEIADHFPGRQLSALQSRAYVRLVVGWVPPGPRQTSRDLVMRLEEEHGLISIYGREISSIADGSQLPRYGGFDGARPDRDSVGPAFNVELYEFGNLKLDAATARH
ncbi:hypothetical protein N7530_003246 [Penicillium desertorum]|uniref:Myb-like domain-containing protein n=1 Tax=Penicillium desertorum TaxID=1303715 RepID=A0A9W9WWC1_9EURO|nr:hypothetical protein N7530_003246 [Penicillium desertorum]